MRRRRVGRTRSKYIPSSLPPSTPSVTSSSRLSCLGRFLSFPPTSTRDLRLKRRTEPRPRVAAMRRNRRRVPRVRSVIHSTFRCSCLRLGRESRSLFGRGTHGSPARSLGRSVPVSRAPPFPSLSATILIAFAAPLRLPSCSSSQTRSAKTHLRLL